MGINNRGQCGTGITSNNVWTPEPVRGLSLTSLPIGGGDKVSDSLAAEQDQPIVQVVLGFQQGYALSKDGQVYSWGKANRGQLGRTVDADQDPWARPIIIDDDNQRVVEIGAGFHHGALLTNDDKVFVWGKNMSRGDNGNTSDDDDEEGEEIGGTSGPSDARTPEQVIGLPKTNDNEIMKVQRISCGSHHTAILMEDGSVHAVGIASDEAIPILDPVELIPAGVLDLPIRQFEAHHDRTTVIDGQGMVYQVHLWKDEILRDYAYFTPSYVDTLLDEGHTIQSIHRGWRHTIIVTS
ncbi:MAG: alpha-tubulin suppressor-like RCC1 family protein [Bacillariaceae sp.]|jgi:alpha-tubulin suppressor-like RCC1 family protein